MKNKFGILPFRPGRLFLKKARLVLALRSSSLALLLIAEKQVLKYEKILLRETPEEVLASRVKTFLGRAEPGETILVLPRQEFLQKEWSLSGFEKDLFEKKIQELLPYPLREMSYGISFNKMDAAARNCEGVLFALPEKRIQEMFLFLKQAGLFPGEVVTEDQPFLWKLREAREPLPVLILDRDEERTLCLLAQEGKVRNSRVLGRTEGDSFFGGKEIGEEISFFLLETGQRPRKIFLSGDWTYEARLEVAKLLGLQACDWETPEKPEAVPAWLYAFTLYGRYPAVSLLPTSLKREKKQRQTRAARQKLALAFLFFLAALALSFASGLLAQKSEIRQAARQIAGLEIQVQEIQEIRSRLDQLRRARESKEKTLLLLKEIARNVPSQIRLKELGFEENGFFLKAEGPSQSSITETVQVLDRLDFFTGVSLRHTRLRRKIGRDIYEFELDGERGERNEWNEEGGSK